MARRTGAPPMRVAVIDDVELIAAGVEGLLAQVDEIVVSSVDHPSRLEEPVDVALFDWFARPSAFPDGIDALLEHDALGSVAIYTWWTTPGLIDVAARKGVKGYLSKRLGADALVEALQAVCRHSEMVVASASENGGDILRLGAADALTARESQVLAMLVDGRSNRQIAESLFVGVDTVKTHLRSIYRKLGVNNRTQAVVRTLEGGF
jgi:two-component system, NarL family, response regulator LiaR